MFKSVVTVNFVSNGVFILIIILFLIDELTSFEIKSQLVKSFTWFGIVLITPLILVWNVLTMKTIKSKGATSILPGLVLIGILIIGPMKIIFASSAWKTQTVLYQHKHLSYKKVEFQMRDVGALGYNKRNVEVTYLTDLFMLVHPMGKNIYESTDWVKIDKEVNELNLKFP